MPAYKDKNKGTWYVSFHYFDWTGKNVRKMKRGFATKKEAQAWEESFLRTKAASMDMTLAEFYTVYEKDVRPKACGVKRIRIHDLRHSHVSLLINMGFSALAIGNWG